MPEPSQALVAVRGHAKRLTDAFEQVRPLLQARQDVTAPIASWWADGTDDLPGAGLAGVEEGVQQARKAILEGTPADALHAARWAVRGGKFIIGAPGKIFDAAQIATARNKGRAAAGVVGGWIGGAGGGLVGEIAGPPGEIAGAAAGNYAGSRAGEYLYDHYPEMQERFRDSLMSNWSRAPARR